MPSRSLLMLCLALIALVVCAACEIVDDDDEALLQKAKNGQYELIKKDELAELHRQADLGKAVGRYQLYRNGYRTWRLDSSTGATCILLTTEEDWKNADTSSQSCALVR